MFSTCGSLCVDWPGLLTGLFFLAQFIEPLRIGAQGTQFITPVYFGDSPE